MCAHELTFANPEELTTASPAGLYGNIGLKVFYINIVEDLFQGYVSILEPVEFPLTTSTSHSPPMASRGGRILWVPMVCICEIIQPQVDTTSQLT